ncbi:MAG: T9SS type A sorting domain-containing protein, partial [Dinghuibacter sp.]|nr:T9SS type A sorting domain-containing protein [Dinghuibacter sp.]
FTISIHPTAQVNTVNNQVVCNNATTTAVNFSTTRTGGLTSYSWVNSNPAIGLAASGTGGIAAFTAVNNTTAPLSGTITVTPVFTNNGVSCSGPAETFTITVNPTATVNTVNNEVVCNNTTTTAVNFSSAATGGTIVYNWTNNNTTIGLAASGSGNIASFNATNNTTAPVTATITVTPVFSNGGVSCTGIARQFTITVNPTAPVNAINNMMECNGATVPGITPQSIVTGGTVTYTWTNSNTSIGLAAGGTGSVPTFTAINTGTAPQTATITITPTFTNGGVSCTGTATSYTVTVNPTAIVNPVNNQVLCNGGSTNAINFGTTATSGTVSYSWVNSNPAIGLALSGTGNIASFNAVNTGTAPATATITVTPIFSNGGVQCPGTAQTFTITVNPTAIINSIANKVVCNGTNLAAINFGSTATGGTVTYSWTNNNTSIGLAASGTGNIASFNAVNNSNVPQTATITVTPVFNNDGVSCTGTAATFTITVNPEVAINSVAGQLLCNNATASAVIFGTNVTGSNVSFSWTNSNPAIGLAASGTGSIPSFTAINNTNAPVTATITVIATYTNAGISCNSAPLSFVYTINPVATVNTIASQTVCNGNPVQAVNFTTPTTGGAVTYQWNNNNPSIGLPASGSGSIASFNATNTSNTPVTATITVTPVFSNGGVTCTGTAQNFTITVNPTALVNTVGNQTVCAGLTQNGTSFTSPVAGTTYSWANSNPAIGLAASGTGSVPSFTTVNPSPNAISATITVTPNTAAGCIGQPITYTITVNGLSVAPVSISNSAPIVCASNPVTTLSVNGGALGSGAVWKWYADSLNTVSIGSGATLSNITVPQTTTYFVRAEGACNNTAAASVVVQRANLVHHVRQHWSDVLLFDNSSRNYVAWQWYKNGAAVAGATLQQYSEGNALAGTYYVVATDRNGIRSISCPLTITAGSFTGLRISLFPNPADKGVDVKVSTSFTTAELQGANLAISDIFGHVLQQINQVSPVNNLRAPNGTGMYVVTLTLQNGMKYSANLLTK